MPEFIYLASQSPRRAQLLAQIGVRFELLLPQQGEDAEALENVHGDESPEHYVQRVTDLKLDAAMARLASQDLPQAPVLCSDTTVALGGLILGKPEGAADAARMLALLAGQTHRVITAVALQHQDRRLKALSVSEVSFAPMSAADIDDYVFSGEPMGKAGAYAVQGRAAMYITRIGGSYTGIMGLPLYETASLLRAAGMRLSSV